MSTTSFEPEAPGPEVLKREWLGRLEALVNEVKGWAESAGWRARRITKTVHERALGKYAVPVLLMEKDTVEVVLNPVARFVPGASGAVDLYLSPAYDDIANLSFEHDKWVVHYCERPDPLATGGVIEVKTRAYNKETICQILDGMAVGG